MMDNLPGQEWDKLRDRLQASLRDPAHRHIDGTRATQHVLQAIGSSPQIDPGRRAVNRRAFSMRRWMSRWMSHGVVGVITVLVVGLGVSKMTDNGDSIAFSAQTYITQFGERAMVRLPDGSQVTLAPRTRLQYGTSADGERLVTLDGQAYFTVQEHLSQPFVVHTDDVYTQVLGTTFDIRSYAADHRTQVLLLSGKVSVGRSHIRQEKSARILTPGMLATLTDSTTIVSHVNDPETLTDWVRGRLVFRNTAISDVLATVGRWSGYQFQIADSALAQGRVTTVLMVGKPENTMRMLGDLLDATLVVKDSTVTLYPRRSSDIRRTQPLVPGTPFHTTASGVGR